MLLLSKKQINFISTNIFIILSFALIYYLIDNMNSNHFIKPAYLNNSMSLLDSLYLSLQVESTVGHGGVHPNSNLTKFLMSLQMFVVILSIGLLS